MAVGREEKVEQSVQTFAADVLRGDGWSEAKLEILDSFPFDQFEGSTLDKNYLAFGFNFDDLGRRAELGSDLTTRIYTLEFFVFGTDGLSAKRIANAIKFAVDAGKIIPLLDVGVAGTPQIDALVVDGSSSGKVQVPDPQPYQESVWLTTVRVEDTYYSSEA